MNKQEDEQSRQRKNKPNLAESANLKAAVVLTKVFKTFDMSETKKFPCGNFFKRPYGYCSYEFVLLQLCENTFLSNAVLRAVAFVRTSFSCSAIF